MKSGIYELRFEDGSTYIGQSLNLEKRQKRHLYSLINRIHHNKYVQEKYDRFNSVIFNILEICTEKLLLLREIYYCNKVPKEALLNINEPGQKTCILNGSNNGRSKYDESEIVFIMECLATTNITKKELAEYTPVSYSMIRQIASGTTHKWLEEKYPLLYLQMRSKIKKQNTYTIKSPEGVEYTITSQRAFSNKYNIPLTGLGQLLNNKRDEIHGWTLIK